MTRAIKVLIVDDSALIREMLASIINSDPALTVVGTAPDALKAREMIKRLNPDVVTLDIEMPKMNGIDFLRKIMKLRPMPVVMISTMTQNSAAITLEALEIGAVDFVAKPKHDVERELGEKAKEIIAKVKTAANAKVKPLEQTIFPVVKEPMVAMPGSALQYNMIVIGASTGGVEALRTIFSDLPKEMPPIFVVQHMPKQFTKTFAQRLNGLGQLNVHEAEDYMIARSGHVYIAPGDRHLRVAKSKGEVVCRLMEGNPVSGHIPSVDVLFDSVCHVDPRRTIGVILSGMGKDGAESMLKMHQAGSYTVGQDEQSCVVYGMPKAAYEKGGVDVQADLNKIADVLISLCYKNEETE
ncbi:chemotaxis response regulator protein-glutamate methylesterase [Terasakiella brassicae]|uniref:Protein-glutamate methylesterase/protein-glutamine glutaminase n=1 Tax=Terasakiella brassicae TaxID=1634917 RepID=A0A917F7C6_9PROT|nr:chemotaxis response regulator protein-glutamate methylesterase [Terasakiella brassicae]GGF50966.1 chemotaxis response regulator protein-glutamate methylesterase [Terasakiella brassicae]